MSKKLAKITENRLGESLKGQDVLIPKHHNIKTLKNDEITKLDKEPTTVRFSKTTLVAIDKIQTRLFEENDLRASKSEIIEASVRTALQKFDALGKEIKELKK